MIALTWLACADTGGERIAFEVVAGPAVPADADGTRTFVDDDGWSVTLTEATLAVGPLYLWSGEPLATPTARGASDDFEYGFLRGELPDQVAVDLLGAPTPLGTGDGLAGETRSAELWLAPPVAGSALDETLTLAGLASRDDVAVPFHFALTIDDELVDAQAGETAFERRKVRGIPVTADLSDGGTLTVAVDAARLLVAVDFEDVAALGLSADEPVPPATVPFLQLYYNARQSGLSGPYVFTFTP